jgi:hypothetical protein
MFPGAVPAELQKTPYRAPQRMDTKILAVTPNGEDARSDRVVRLRSVKTLGQLPWAERPPHPICGGRGGSGPLVEVIALSAAEVGALLSVVRSILAR